MTSTLPPLRKLIPIKTLLKTSQAPNTKVSLQDNNVSRKINTQKLSQQKKIKEAKIAEATEIIEQLLKTVTTKREQRKTKLWFDANC